jgi:Family of unknown function (DUF5343)
MAGSTLPYVTAHGNISKALEKIKAASTPPRFTQDFLSTTLGMPGGSAKPVIPFLKRTGFLATDGSPTDRYKRFRNSAQSGAAAAEALRAGYKPLYDINEYVHDAKDADLRGLIVQVTGSEEDSRLVQAVTGSFKALKSFADFSAPVIDGAAETTETPPPKLNDDAAGDVVRVPSGINLGYTINLHLPATSDIAVFNAIFKSLREHLLR